MDNLINTALKIGGQLPPFAGNFNNTIDNLVPTDNLPDEPIVVDNINSNFVPPRSPRRNMGRIVPGQTYG